MKSYPPGSSSTRIDKVHWVPRLLILDGSYEDLIALLNGDGREWAEAQLLRRYATRQELNRARLLRRPETLPRGREFLDAGRKMAQIARVLADEWLLARSDYLKRDELAPILLGAAKAALERIELAPWGLDVDAFYESAKTAKGQVLCSTTYYALRFIASQWSLGLFKCQRCGRYFIREHARAAEPVCSRKCRNRATSKKLRQRARDDAKRIEALRRAVAWFNALPEARRRKDKSRCRAVVVKRACQSLPPRLHFTERFVWKYCDGKVVAELDLGGSDGSR